MNEAGINAEGLDRVCLEILDYAEQINNRLLAIEDVIYHSANALDCDEATEFRNKFSNLSSNFQVVNQMLQNYTNELQRVKHNTETLSEDLSVSIKQNISNVVIK